MGSNMMHILLNKVSIVMIDLAIQPSLHGPTHQRTRMGRDKCTGTWGW
jgi:hypothetical protein